MFWLNDSGGRVGGGGSVSREGVFVGAVVKRIVLAGSANSLALVDAQVARHEMSGRVCGQG
jgi:hypothetical protein